MNPRHREERRDARRGVKRPRIGREAINFICDNRKLTVCIEYN